MNLKCRGWRDGSNVKSTDCSSRGPEFNSQQLSIMRASAQNVTTAGWRFKKLGSQGILYTNSNQRE